MCVIIYRSAAADTITKYEFNRAWDTNPDGFGLAFSDGKELVVKKSMNKKEAWKIYSSFEKKYPYSPKILHFRIGTGGKKDVTNCHPFEVGNDTVMFHNGIIGESDNIKSDTNILAGIIKNLKLDIMNNGNAQDLLQFVAGTYSNKLVFLNAAGEVLIINEDLGFWEKGVWYSNLNFRTKWSYFDEYDYKTNKKDNRLYPALEKEPFYGNCEGCGLYSDNLHYNHEFNCMLCDTCAKEYSFEFERD